MRMLILGGRGDESGIEIFRQALAQSVVFELQSACSHPAKEFLCQRCPVAATSSG